MGPHHEPSSSEIVDSAVPAANPTNPSGEAIVTGGPFPKLPTFQDKYAERQYMKERLALAFRIFAKLGFDEGVAGHITLRVCVFFSVFFL